MKSALESLGLRDKGKVEQWRETYAELSRRTSSRESFHDFVVDSLVLKSAYTLLTKDDDDDPEKLQETLPKLCDDWRHLEATVLQTSEAFVFSTVVRERVAASSVVLRNALGGSGCPRLVVSTHMGTMIP